MHPLPKLTDRDNWQGVRVVLRLDLNVPLEDGKVRDAYRITRSLPTLQFLRERGARTVIISHIGKGKPEDTLRPVADYLQDNFPVSFLPTLRSEDNQKFAANMEDGDIALLENVRHDPGEEANDPEFAKYLASLGEVYVNDAFAVSHRAHASVVGIPALLPSYAGFLFADEVAHLAEAFTPEHPFLFVLGGAKIGTKMPLLKKFLGLADHVFVGGAIANNFIKAAGHEIGKSVYDPDEMAGLHDTTFVGSRLLIPLDVIVEGASGTHPAAIDGVGADEKIMDVGQGTIDWIERIVGDAKLVVWNGPLGYYEGGYKDGTRELLELIAGSSAKSIIGGGDTVALIDELGMLEKFTFVSTGGGAMLDFLANETLPGIEALKGAAR